MKYKLNKYNYFYQVNGDVVCLDLLQKVSITIPYKNYLLIEHHKNSIEELNDVNKHLFSLLYKTGFIIDYDIDEFKIVKSKYNSEIFRNNTYRLTILPTMDCNFSCWYCYEDKIKGLMNSEIQERIIEHVKRKIEIDGISNLQLDWFGGEPLLGFDRVIYPLSKKIISLAKKNEIHFSNQITTNGYLLTNKMLSQLIEIQLNNFQITLDGNEEAHNKIKNGKNAYKKTITNINMLCEGVEKAEIALRINYTDESLKTSLDIIDDFPKINRTKLRINFQKVWQLIDKSDKSLELVEIKQKFEDEGFNIFSYELKDVSVCYANQYEQAVISYDGNVFKCTARDFKKENADGYLEEDGLIEWNIDKHSRRFGINAFEKYEQCRVCDILPACYGPCSQKVLETNMLDFNKICNYEGIKSSLNELLKKNYDKIFN
jgi:uncharacterized protein